MEDFEYSAAVSLDEAVSLLAAKGEKATVLAGGTDILVQLREGLRSADLVVDLKKIPELTRYDFSLKTGLKLGAAVPCCKLYRNSDLLTAYPALCDAARIIGGWQIQSRASIGGNLCNSSPAADSIPGLMAYGVTCEIIGPDGRRSVPAADFCTAPGKNVLRRGEILVSLQFPAPVENASAAYLRFIPRNEMDIAVVGVASWVKLSPDLKKIEKARIALAAVAPTPVMATGAMQLAEGMDANAQTYEALGAKAVEAVSPITDMRGTAEYRKHLVKVLVKRTLTNAVARARGETATQHG